MKIYLLTFLSLFLFIACDNTKHKKEVIIYTSVDQHYSEPIFTAFEKETGIHVRAVFDIESSKTTGLVNRLIAEKNSPRC